MTTLETKPTPSGPKNSNSIPSEPWRSKSQESSGSNTRNGPKKKVMEKKKNTIDILDDWDPNNGGMATHIEFIHQSMMDLATGIEKVGVINNNVKIVSDQLTIIENHIIRVDKRLEKLEALDSSLRKSVKMMEGYQNNLCEEQTSISNRITKMEENQESLHKEHMSIANRMVKMEERLQEKIENSRIESNNSIGTDESNKEHDGCSKKDVQLLLAGNTVVIDSNLQKMEERLQKKIEDTKVELSTTFETEAEVCRNIYITEMMNQVNSIKGKGSSVRYMGKKESQVSSISRLSSILPSFGEELSPKKSHTRIISKEED